MKLKKFYKDTHFKLLAPLLVKNKILWIFLLLFPHFFVYVIKWCSPSCSWRPSGSSSSYENLSIHSFVCLYNPNWSFNWLIDINQSHNSSYFHKGAKAERRFQPPRLPFHILDLKTDFCGHERHVPWIQLLPSCFQTDVAETFSSIRMVRPFTLTLSRGRKKIQQFSYVIPDWTAEIRESK